jgi:hypothetical protein
VRDYKVIGINSYFKMVDRYREDLLALRAAAEAVVHQQLVDPAAAIARQQMIRAATSRGPMFWQARLLTLIVFALSITNRAKGSSTLCWLHYLTTR